MPFIAIGGKKFSFEELKTISSVAFTNEIEKSAIKFCQAWLSGQPSFTLHTSGSTGAPKEIKLSRLAMEASAKQTTQALELKEIDTALVCLDTKYIAGQMMLVRSLVLGMNILVVEPSANPFDKTEDQQIDFVALVPYQLENILNQTPEKLDGVRCAIIGGATVSYLLKEKIQKNKCAIYATYGMTETLSHIALQKLNGTDAQDYFEAFENIQLRLDERGCLCIKADYLGEEVVTNDLVELIDRKKFKWLGRVDNVINSGGIKIIPEKIENVVEQIFNLLQINRRFFIAGIIDEKLGQRVVLFMEGNKIDHSVVERFFSELTRHLSKYELPKEIKFVNRFTDTSTGKINRAASVVIHLQQT
jgi:o-succinylbenzoate---CoA ligase